MSAADGTWKTTIKSPMGAQTGTLTITTSGDSFTGKMDTAQGSQDVSGKVDGDTLTWTSQLTQPMPRSLEFTLTAAGDTLNGSVKAGSFGSFPVEGVRA